MAKSVVFFDTEVGVDDKKIHDIGAVRSDKGTLHTAAVSDFCAFAANADFLCGHNVVHHDMKYLAPVVDGRVPKRIIDTLYLSPLLFPKRPYHRLVKDDKLQVEELNNPVNDSQKAQTLFFDEVCRNSLFPKDAVKKSSANRQAYPQKIRAKGCGRSVFLSL